MRVLVTGGAGFIGSNLVDGLLRDGHEVRVLDNFSTGHRSNLAHVRDDVEVVEGDLRSYERVSRAVRGCELVFHQGALPSVPRSVQDPLTSSEINIGGTLNVLLAARDEGVRPRRLRLVVVGLRRCAGLPARRDPGHEPARALRRLQARRRAVLPRRAPGVRPGDRLPALLQRLRPPPGPVLAVQRRLPKFIVAMRDGEAPTIYGDGSSRATSPISTTSSRRTCSRDRPRRGRQVLQHRRRPPGVAQRADGPAQRGARHADRAAVRRTRAGDVKHSLADVGRAERELGFDIAVTLGEARAARSTPSRRRGRPPSRPSAEGARAVRSGPVAARAPGSARRAGSPAAPSWQGARPARPAPRPGALPPAPAGAGPRRGHRTRRCARARAPAARRRSAGRCARIGRRRRSP